MTQTLPSKRGGLETAGAGGGSAWAGMLASAACANAHQFAQTKSAEAARVPGRTRRFAELQLAHRTPLLSAGDHRKELPKAIAFRPFHCELSGRSHRWRTSTIRPSTRRSASRLRPRTPPPPAILDRRSAGLRGAGPRRDRGVARTPLRRRSPGLCGAHDPDVPHTGMTPHAVHGPACCRAVSQSRALWPRRPCAGTIVPPRDFTFAALQQRTPSIGESV